MLIEKNAKLQFSQTVVDHGQYKRISKIFYYSRFIPPNQDEGTGQMFLDVRHFHWIYWIRSSDQTIL